MASFTRFLGKLMRDDRGNVAMMFGLAAIALIGVGGLAIDYTSANTMRTRLAAAADAAVLAGAQQYGKTEAERLATARAHFYAAIGVHTGIENIVFSGQDILESGSVVGLKLNVNATTPTSLGRVFGVNTVPLGIEVQARGGASEHIEMALVLDKTGSMAGAKLTALQTAANEMMTTLLAKAATPGQVKFAIVPFAEHVQIGLSEVVPVSETGA